MLENLKMENLTDDVWLPFPMGQNLKVNSLPEKSSGRVYLPIRMVQI